MQWFPTELKFIFNGFGKALLATGLLIASDCDRPSVG
jgi:hypothetical protein